MQRNVFLSFRNPAPDYAAMRATKRRAKSRAKFCAQASDAMREIAVYIAVLACGVPIAAILHAVSSYYYG